MPQPRPTNRERSEGSFLSFVLHRSIIPFVEDLPLTPQNVVRAVVRRGVSQGSSPAPMSLFVSNHRQVRVVTCLFAGHRETNGAREHMRLVERGMQHPRFRKLAIDPAPVAHAGLRK